MNTSISENDSVRLSQLKGSLDIAGIAYTIHVHAQNISSTRDGAQTGLGALSAMAPTFILRTEAGYLAAIIRGDTRLSYKKIKQTLGLKNVSLAAPEQVKGLTGSEIGQVSMVNQGLKTILDERVMELESVYGGTGISSHTLQISPRALATITQAQVFNFTELKES
jgi:prolyl-tRNA editing enzyme YbaK/EbsC (Cys-tRNA(Pro) deacylase)